MRCFTLALALFIGTSASHSATPHTTGNATSFAHNDTFFAPDLAGTSASTDPLPGAQLPTLDGDAADRIDAAASSRIALAALDTHRRTRSQSALERRPLDSRSATRSNATSAEESTNSAWLMGLVTIALIGYQLRRKHRLLRPQRFTF